MRQSVVRVMIVAVLFAAGGCRESDERLSSPSPSTTAEPDVAGSDDQEVGSRAVGAQAAPSEWSGAHLPKAAGKMRITGDVGVYFADADRQLYVVAVDVLTGRELWRQPVDQHGQPTGLVGVPTVDAVTMAVIATTVHEGRPTLSSFDVGDGAENWVVETAWSQGLPQPCAEKLVCLFSVEPTAAVLHDVGTGRVHRVLEDIGGSRTVAFDAGLRLSVDGDEAGTAELGRITADGYERIWRLRFDDLTHESEAGHYGPGGGWRARIHVPSRMSVFAVGAETPPDATDDQWTDAIMRGHLVAVVDGEGNVVLSRARVDPCTDLYWTATSFVLCDEYTAAVIHGAHPDGEDAPEPVFRRFSSYRLPSLEEVFSPVLSKSVPLWHGVLADTSDPALSLVGAGDPDAVLFDRTDGTLTPVADHPGPLAVGCNPGDVDPSEDLRALVDTANELGVSYRVTYGPLALCDVAGDPIDPVAWLESGQAIPSWFGIAVVGDDDEHHTNGIDQPAVWMDVNRQIHAAYRPPGS